MSIEKNPTNLELLRLAKELAYADYNNRRANIHNQWLVDNETMQKTRRMSVPYPAIPSYPTEEEIIFRAQKLIGFLSQPRPDIEKQQLHQEVKQLITEVEQEIGKSTEVEEPIKTTPTTVSPEDSSTLDAIEKPIVEPEKTSVLSKLKSAWR